MKTLEEICISTIVAHNIDYSVWFMPELLHEALEREKIIQSCGRNVQNCIKEANGEFLDYFFGWTKGLNSVNQNKDYRFRNAMCFEKCLRKNIDNWGLPLAPLSIYYLSQEDDFNTWYDKNFSEKLGCYCGDYGKKIGYVNSLTTLYQTWDHNNYQKIQ
jgi:hypothetical protein